jgi:hypothetical protein
MEARAGDGEGEGEGEGAGDGEAGDGEAGGWADGEGDDDGAGIAGLSVAPPCATVLAVEDGDGLGPAVMQPATTVARMSRGIRWHGPERRVVTAMMTRERAETSRGR